MHQINTKSMGYFFFFRVTNLCDVYLMQCLIAWEIGDWM